MPASPRPSQATADTRVLHECRICKRSYAKAEHLTRHERTHTGAKPFSCPVCHRTFSRQDSLHRHAKVHTIRDLPPSPGVTDQVNEDTIHIAGPQINSSVTSPTLLQIAGRSHISDSTKGHPSATSLARGEVAETDSGSAPSQISSRSLFSDNSQAQTHATSPITGSAPAQTSIRDSFSGSVQAQVQTTSSAAAPSHRQTIDELIQDDTLMSAFEPPEFDLEWPDAEGLLQTIVSSDFQSWTLPMGALPFSHADWTLTPGSSVLQEGGPSGGHRAVQDLSQMILNLPSSVAIDAESFTSVFLDQCFHEFWEKFLPVLPVLHRPTFVFKDCSQPLLLNAIALGSLFIARRDAQMKGQALWRLAHMAVATSWQSLITHRGPYDTRPGVQLVLTAVLGQTYAIFSKDRNLRMTARVFHSLGFGWARHCGMLDPDSATVSDWPLVDVPDKEDRWRRWAAGQVQHRAILAHYALDGLISHFTGMTTSVRHSSNLLPANVPDFVFEAPTPDECILAMSGIDHALPFADIYRSLIYNDNRSSSLGSIPSLFSVAVILEGFQSMCTESEESDGRAVGVGSAENLRKGLYAIYPYLSGEFDHFPNGADVLVRWHLLCMERAVPTAHLCKALCLENKIKQHIYGVSDSHLNSGGSLTTLKNLLGVCSTREWVGSIKARQALLHAVALQRCLEKTPLNRAQGLALPGAVFATATIFAAYAINNTSTVMLPGEVNWSDALILPMGPHTDSETKRFLRGESLSYGTTTNVLYNLNTVHNLLRRLCLQWGVCSEMDEVLDKWIAICH